ncbi:MAG: carotenoid biosynthesis protein [Chthoniobacteraceae bacterium]
MLRPPTLLARGLEPLVNALWVFFIVWSIVVAALWMGGERAVDSIAHSDLRAAANVVAGASDTLWLVLASANLYLHLAEREGLPRARFIALAIGVTAGALAACSTWTSYPLGAVFYTSKLGTKLGPLPLGWPLLWFAIIVSGRELIGRIFRRMNETSLAVATGTLAALTDLNLEPIATKIRLYWFWYVAGSHDPSPPLWRNSATWFVAATALAWLLREHKISSLRSNSWRPGAILVVINTIFSLAHLRQAIFG